MNIYEDLKNIEELLRLLIIDIMSSKYGNNWEEKKLHKKLHDSCINKKNKAAGQKYKSLIYYSDLSDIKEFINSYFEDFKDAFNENYTKERVNFMITEANVLRNAVLHFRDIHKEDEYIINGISKRLKKIISIYLNKKENMDKYLPKIISIHDSFGDEFGVVGKSSNYIEEGGELSLIINAIDPFNRELEYCLDLFNKNRTSDNHIKYIAPSEGATRGLTIDIFIRFKGSKQNYDDSAVIKYKGIIPKK